MRKAVFFIVITVLMTFIFGVTASAVACVPGPNHGLPQNIDEASFNRADIVFIGIAKTGDDGVSPDATKFLVLKGIKGIKNEATYSSIKRYDCNIRRPGDIWLIMRISLPPCPVMPTKFIDGQTGKPASDEFNKAFHDAECKERFVELSYNLQNSDPKLLDEVKKRFGFDILKAPASAPK